MPNKPLDRYHFAPVIFLETKCSFVNSFLSNVSLDRSTLIDLKKEASGITNLFQSFNLIEINRQANTVWQTRLPNLALIIVMMVY